MATTTLIILQLLILTQVTALCQKGVESAPRIASRLELILDDLLIEELMGRAMQLRHRPIAREIFLRHDAPWEGQEALM